MSSAAFERPDGYLSEQTSRRLQLARDAMTTVVDQYGLLSLYETSELIGYNKHALRELRIGGHLLGVRRRGILRFPGFQFRDHPESDSRISIAIRPLVTAARWSGMTDEDLYFWMAVPNPILEWASPAELLFKDPDWVIEVGNTQLNTGW